MLYVASDHAGFALKQHLLEVLRERGIAYEDLGCQSTDRIDYVPYAFTVSMKVAEKPGSLGLLVCGTGLGMCIAANKVKGVRATLCHDVFSAKMAKAHNDSNVLCMGGRVIGTHAAAEVLKSWLATEFEGGKHADRLTQICEWEGKNR